MPSERVDVSSLALNLTEAQLHKDKAHLQLEKAFKPNFCDETPAVSLTSASSTVDGHCTHHNTL